MENTGYIALTRQSGLFGEMRIIANNIANSATTGYRQEGAIFSEFVKQVDRETSVSMASARIVSTEHRQGALRQTDAPFDFAIEGDGFFVVETAAGPRLSRAGAFTPNAGGDLVTSDGDPVLDVGGAPIFIPPDAGSVRVAPDGTISAGDRLLGQVGVVMPENPLDLVREDGVKFNAPGGFIPVENPRVAQGFLETSNVDPVHQLARMIEVQRAYELGQSFLEQEDNRVREALRAFVE